MADLITIGSRTSCATTAAAPYLQRLGCTRSGIGGCGYIDIAGNTVNGHDWVCPQDVYQILSNMVLSSNSGSISVGHLGPMADRYGRAQQQNQVATSQPRQTQTPQQAVQAGIDDVTKPTQPVVDSTTYWKPTTQQPTPQSYSQSPGQQPTPTTQPVQASIIPSGWGWPIAIGGTVIVVGTIIGMWYRNRRGM